MQRIETTMGDMQLPSSILGRLKIDPTLTRNLLVRFIREEFHKAGFRRTVFGLSGGLDSTVAAYLAVEALGAENVFVIRMPYRTSSSASLSDADLVIKGLGLSAETIEITQMAEPLFACTPEINALRKGNVMARLRMIISYDRSAQHNALVLGTSNKTELLLGYGTIFGDLGHAINPLGDLYKTQVRELARALEVPAGILNKAPSADLAPNQTDEGDFGFTYESADQILYLLVDERYSVAEVIGEGFPPALVQRIAKMVQRNQYKRQMPLIPKISGRSITHDFRYLRDWGN